MSRRALHFVFKIGNRIENATFYRNVLGMKFLRHEEFEEGCKASCNGPYDGKWSKSMVGYGSEDTHFVIELTYNYGIGTYKIGNDFRGLTVCSKTIVQNARTYDWSVGEENGQKFVTSPDGHRFYIVEEDSSGDPVKKVSLSCSNLQMSCDYWKEKCGMTVFCKTDNSLVLGYSDDQFKLELVDIGSPVDHAKAFGRIAFGCPREQLSDLEKQMKDSGEKILTPLVSLDTPGKATVEVVILADPDGHEICFVGDEAFRELSQTDPKADELLDQAIKADKSDEWYAKKGKSKGVA